MLKQNKTLQLQILLAAAWLLATLLVWPMGEFPLNDDWAYSHNVYALSEHHRLEFSDWPAMTLLTQMLWGAAWCKIFGFSFSVLRLSVWALAGVSLWLAGRWYRQHSQSGTQAAWGVALLAMCPLFFNLSFTFMTEVPFVCLALLATVTFLRWLDTARWTWLAGATTALVAGVLLRQTAIIFSVAFAGTALVVLWGRWRLLLSTLAALTLPFLALHFYVEWLADFRGELPTAFSTTGDFWQSLQHFDFGRPLRERFFGMLFYAGVFTLPVLTTNLPAIRQMAGLKTRLVLVAVAGVTIFSTWKISYGLPIDNLIYNAGVGPKLLHDSYLHDQNLHPFLSETALKLLRAAGSVAAGWFAATVAFRVLQVGRQIRRRSVSPTLLLGLLVGLGFCLFLIPGNFFFDRYLLPPLPFVLPLVLLQPGEKAATPRRGFTWAGSALLALYVWFTVSATHDYLAWNRARWTGLYDLMQQGIGPERIDGGFEFNGWFKTGPRQDRDDDLKSWWFVNDDEFRLCFGPSRCRDVYAAYPYANWLAGSTDSIFVLRRPPLDSARLRRIVCSMDPITPDGKEMLGSDTTVHFGNINARQRSPLAHSGEWVTALDGDKEYGCTTVIDGIAPCSRVFVSAWYRSAEPTLGIVVNDADNRDRFYRLNGDTLRTPSAERWQQMRVEVPSPKGYPGQKIVVFLWNHGKKPVLVDDFTIEVFN